MPRQPLLSPFPGADHAHAACLEQALRTAEQVCADRGARLTQLRRRVLELVCASHEPIKPYELLHRLRRRQRNAAPPTVYRALEFLRVQGFVHKLQSLNAYVGCGAPGHGGSGQFLICRGCGAVAEMADIEVAGLLSERARGLGFTADSQTVEVRGTCPGCRERARA